MQVKVSLRLQSHFQVQTWSHGLELNDGRIWFTRIFAWLRSLIHNRRDTCFTEDAAQSLCSACTASLSGSSWVYMPAPWRSAFLLVAWRKQLMCAASHENQSFKCCLNMSVEEVQLYYWVLLLLIHVFVFVLLMMKDEESEFDEVSDGFRAPDWRKLSASSEVVLSGWNQNKDGILPH